MLACCLILLVLVYTASCFTSRTVLISLLPIFISPLLVFDDTQVMYPCCKHCFIPIYPSLSLFTLYLSFCIIPSLCHAVFLIMFFFSLCTCSHYVFFLIVSKISPTNAYPYAASKLNTILLP